MLKKLGINQVMAQKKGPVIKDGVSHRKAETARAQKTVTCKCGKKYLKDCPTEAACAVSVLTCPNCGAKIQ